jgi:multiple sugar transport system ATP-binding protein
MIYVTHDQIEAMTLADRIALLRDGKIEQLGTPLDLFERPATRFVAGFLGSPKMNFLPATIEAGEVILRNGTRLTLPIGRKAPNGQAVILGLRPQHIAKASAIAAPGHVHLPSTVELVQPTGSRVQVSMPIGGISITAEFSAHEVTTPGEQVCIDIDMTRAVLIDPQTDMVI